MKTVKRFSIPMLVLLAAAGTLTILYAPLGNQDEVSSTEATGAMMLSSSCACDQPCGGGSCDGILAGDSPRIWWEEAPPATAALCDTVYFSWDSEDWDAKSIHIPPDPPYEWPYQVCGEAVNTGCESWFEVIQPDGQTVTSGFGHLTQCGTYVIKAFTTGCTQPCCPCEGPVVITQNLEVYWDAEIRADKNEITLCEQAHVTVEGCVPANAEVRLINSSPDIVDLQQNGTVTPLMPGSATIRAILITQGGGICGPVSTTITVLGDDGGCSDCGGSSGAGSGSVNNGSVDVRLSMGRGLEGESIGSIRLQAEQPSSAVATPDILDFNVDRSDIVVVRDSGVLRQILAPEALADVVTVNSQKYRVDYYLNDSNVTFNGTSGLYESPASPFAKWTIENPDTLPTANRLKITHESQGAVKNIYMFTGTVASNDWTLERQDASGTTLVSEEVSWSTNGSVKTKTFIVKDDQGTEAYRTEQDYTQYTLGYDFDGTQFDDDVELITRIAIDPNGENLVRNRVYYTSGNGMGKLKSETRPDGSWVWYAYDSEDRVSKMVEPSFSDSALADPPSMTTNQVTAYSYIAVDSEEVIDPGTGEPTVHPERPRTVTVTINDKPGPKTFYAYLPNNVVVEERCQSHSSGYGSTNNLRTTTTYESPDEERMLSVIYPDDRKDTYTYTVGDFTYNSGDPGGSTFTPDARGEDLQTVITHGTISSLDGIANKTTQDVSITDKLGRRRFQETKVYTGGTNYERIEWAAWEFDEYGRITDTHSSDHTHTETVWSCCNQSSTVDATGIETTYTYDDFGRVETETKEGVEASGSYLAQKDLVTTYERDPMGRVTKVTTSGTDGSSTITMEIMREYDNAGRLKTETDAGGLNTTYTYGTVSGGGRKVTKTYPGGFTEITEYHRDGRVKSVIGTAVVERHYTYEANSSGQIVTTELVGGAHSERWVKTYTDILGRTVMTERPGYPDGLVQTTNEYDDDGRLIKTEPNTMLAPAKGGGYTATPGGADQLREYDALGNLIRSGADINDNDQLDLASMDRITDTDRYYEKDGSDNWWSVSVTKVYPTDNNGTAVTVSTQKQQLTGLPLGTTSLTKSIDVHGNDTVSTTEIDRTNKLVTRTTDTPNSTADAVSITRNGLLQSSASATGLKLTYEYDLLGRQTKSIHPMFGATTTTYNADHRVASVADPASNTVAYTYDPMTGRLEMTQNQLNQETRFEYNARGQVKRVWGDVPYPVELRYSNHGERARLLTFRGGSGWDGTTWPANPGTDDTTIWTYDEATGLMEEKKYADGEGVQYKYTRSGAITKRIWSREVGGNAVTTDYDYDDDTGELTEIDYSDSTPDVTFQYNRFGSLKQVTDAIGTRTFSYNASLQLESEDLGLGGVVVGRGYDGPTDPVPGRYNALMVGTDTDPDAYYLSEYEYEIRGRLYKITGPGLPTNGANYNFYETFGNPGGVLTSGIHYIDDTPEIRFAVGKLFEFNRPLVNMHLNFWYIGAPPSVVSWYDYENDAAGRRENVVRTGVAFGDHHFDLWGYNNRNEIIDSSRYLGTDPGDTSNPVTAKHYDYTYDNIGNREDYTVAGGTPTTYASNNLNQYAAIANPSESFTYDRDGNMETDGWLRYLWDAENRLVAIERNLSPMPINAWRRRFEYDYMGRRVGRIYEQWNGSDWTPQEYTQFIYDGWNVLMERDALAEYQILRRFTWGLDLSGQNGNPSPSGIHGVGGVGGLLAVHDLGDTPASPGDDLNYIYTYDANGNVSELIDWTDLADYASLGLSAANEWHASRIVAHYEYDPFGNLQTSSGPYDIDNPFRFSTKYAEVETKYRLPPNVGTHYYYGYRYYDPRLGRWLNRDPMGEVDGANSYQFVSNAPTFHIDYAGLNDIRHLPREERTGNSIGKRTVTRSAALDKACPKEDGWEIIKGAGTKDITTEWALTGRRGDHYSAYGIFQRVRKQWRAVQPYITGACAEGLTGTVTSGRLRGDFESIDIDVTAEFGDITKKLSGLIPKVTAAIKITHSSVSGEFTGGSIDFSDCARQLQIGINDEYMYRGVLLEAHVQIQSSTAGLQVPGALIWGTQNIHDWSESVVTEIRPLVCRRKCCFDKKGTDEPLDTPS
ncbi:MAG: hypothetical protein MI923_17155 [Phycisphaerales bacterium]|nr:hypothetical protein [Phycisphaerales bacterium]